MSESEIFICRRCGEEHEATSQEIASYSCPKQNKSSKALDNIVLWKDVLGYEDFYSVSDKGEVFSKRLDRILKQRRTKKGYMQIGLYNKYKRSKNFLVHRLVAESFWGRNDKEVNHKNSIRHDNRLVNLEWATRKENLAHAKESGNILSGSKHPNSKNNPDLINKILEAKRTESLSLLELKQRFNVSMIFIKEVLRGVTSNEALTQEVASYSCPNQPKPKGKLKMLDQVSLKYLTEVNTSSETQDPHNYKRTDSKSDNGAGNDDD